VNTKNVWTFSGLFVMAAILFGTSMFGVMPTLLAMQSVDNERQSIVYENQARTSYLEELKTTSNNKEALFLAVSSQRDLFPVKLDAVEFMNELEEISKSTGASVANLSISPTQPFSAPSSPTDANGYEKALRLLGSSTLAVSDVALTLHGSLSQTQAFLEKLHTGNRYVLIYKAVLPAGAGSAGNPNVSIDLSAQIFTLSANK
jgi:hypothetical protein